MSVSNKRGTGGEGGVRPRSVVEGESRVGVTEKIVVSRGTRRNEEKHSDDGLRPVVSGVSGVAEVTGEELERLVGPTLEMRDGNFRFAGQRCFLTYKGWLDKVKYREWIVGKKKNSGGVRRVELAHESGDKHHQYQHTHVLVDFGKAHQTRDVRWFDYEAVHPHVKSVKSVRHWNNCLVYMSKEDKECAGLASEGRAAGGGMSLVDRVMACENEVDAYRKFVEKPGDYIGVREMWNDGLRRRAREGNGVYVPEDEMRDWQRAFMRVMKQGKSDRAVNWVYDRHGAAGKTMWAHHMVDTYGHDWVLVSSVGRELDFNNNVKNALESGWNGAGLIVDLPRAMCDKEHIYSCLEGCVNGRVTCTKYSGGSYIIGKPHVWVFSNFLPSVERMSLDRWRVFEVGRHGKGCALLMLGKGGWYRTRIESGIIPFSYVRAVESSDSDSVEDYYVDV